MIRPGLIFSIKGDATPFPNIPGPLDAVVRITAIINNRILVQVMPRSNPTWRGIMNDATDEASLAPFINKLTVPHVAVMYSSFVRDTQVYTGNCTEPDIIDDDGWTDYNDAQLFLGTCRFGADVTPEEVRRLFAAENDVTPEAVFLLRFDE